MNARVLHQERSPQIDFLNVLSRDMGSREYINVRRIPEKSKSEKPLNKFYSCDEIKNIVTDDRAHFYAGVYSRSTRSKDGGKKEHTASTKVIWADYDGTQDIDDIYNRLSDAKIPIPSMMISSGHGFHAYWILTERTRLDVSPLVKAIAVATGADAQTAERARIMRIPGTVNVKNGEKRRCEICISMVKRFTHSMNCSRF